MSITYLDFRDARCKNCYKCLRECPVKAISVVEHQARIIDERCILCGTCTKVCPQNAKEVHRESEDVAKMLENREKIAVSIAPSFVSNFKVGSIASMREALLGLGFDVVEETAIGAKIVADEYLKLLKTGTYKNLITSACPAINKMIQMYYPNALPYLARVDTPMLVHAKTLRRRFPNHKIVFIGPCIAKKKEARENGTVDAVLTFEELKEMFEVKGITFGEAEERGEKKLVSRVFPVSTGIIKTLSEKPDNYDYIAVDGVKKCMEILERIDEVEGLFLELNACDYACVNGPCSTIGDGAGLEATAKVRSYAKRGESDYDMPAAPESGYLYPVIKPRGFDVSEREIKEILAKTGKNSPEDELNCGACGYSTCREKAWAVANGFAELEMCVPYMRERAETMSYEIIANSPNGIIVLDYDLKIIEMSGQAKKMLGVSDEYVKGRDLVDYMNPSDFLIAKFDGKNVRKQRIYFEKTKKYAELTITLLKDHEVIFGILNDITEDVNYDLKLAKVRRDTIATTDEVIKKQMRVAQEIASLLGETTAETKVALVNLKKTLSGEDKEEK
ncbi:MAG: [Fe-Fe] hydrogenase large subunit C-terminal domain-containing protein [Christensenellales bacterium]